MCMVDMVFWWRMWRRLLVADFSVIPNSYWLEISKLSLVDQWWKTYLCLEPLAQACSRRPAALKSKSEGKWPARSNAATANRHSSSPLRHLH